MLELKRTHCCQIVLFGIVMLLMIITKHSHSDSEMSCDDCVSAGIWCQEMPQIRNDSGCQYVIYMSCVPVCMDYDVPADGYNCSFETLLSEPLCAVMDGVAYREKSGYFDPRDCGEWCDGDVPDVVEGYYDTLRPDVGEGGFVFLRTDFGVDTETVVTTSALFEADSADLSISKLPDLPSDFDQWPWEPSPEPGDVLEWQDFASDVDPQLGKFSPESEDLLEMPNFACNYNNYFYDAQ